MKPFADSETSTTIGELTVENGTAALAIYGRLKVTRDKAGLKRAKELKALLDAAVEVLEAEQELPVKMHERAEAPAEVRNPFA